MPDNNKIYAYEWEDVTPEDLESARDMFLEKFNVGDHSGAFGIFDRLISPAQDYIKRHHYIEYLSAVSKAGDQIREQGLEE